MAEKGQVLRLKKYGIAAYSHIFSEEGSLRGRWSSQPPLGWRRGNRRTETQRKSRCVFKNRLVLRSYFFGFVLLEIALSRAGLCP